MSTLYLRIPSKAASDSAPNWLALPCPYALVAENGAIEREGEAPLSDLSELIARIQRVVLLLAGSDVTLLHMQVPPLSSSRLKAALPNLVEEQLLCEPSECIFAAAKPSDGLRTIAVAQLGWLDRLAKTFIAAGARHISALPAQLCLSWQPSLSDQPDMVTAAISQHGSSIDLTLRLSAQDGIGISILAEPEVNAAQEIFRTLCALVPAAPIKLFVPQAYMLAYQEALADSPALKERITVSIDNWTRWIAGSHTATLDLMPGLGASAGPGLDWHAWRWPLALAATVLLVNIGALNIDWWRLKNEAYSLRSAMVKIYKSAYPNETVIIDPLAQMRQKIAAAKRDSGMAAPDDFTAITAAFAEAWASVAPAASAPGIATLEYRDRSLLVSLKSTAGRAQEPDSKTLTQQLKAALEMRELTLEPASTNSAGTVWKIRSVK